MLVLDGPPLSVGQCMNGQRGGGGRVVEEEEEEEGK